MFGFTKIKQLAVRAFTKAQPKTDDSGWTIFGSGINAAWPTNWWQMGMVDNNVVKSNPGIEACVGHISRVGALVPPTHVKDLPNGGTERVMNSNALKVLRKPNEYQTRSDLMLNIIRSLLLEGNGYAVAFRNPDFSIRELHLLPSTGTRHFIDPVDGAIYYHVSGNTLMPGGDMLIPARDILHLRMAVSETDMLKGITPIMAAGPSLASGNSILNHNAAFFNNMSRPSGVLTTEMELDSDQTKALRERWQEQSAGLNSGKTPVLSHGLKFDSLSQTAADAELVKFYELSLTDIARIFGIPSALINIDSANSTFSNVESLLEMWVSTSLGALIDSIELKLEDLFQLPVDEHINFDLDHLLRGNLKDRMDGFGKGILAGVYSIDEARRREGLAPVEGGDVPRVQQQNVPLTYYEDKLELDRDKVDIERDKVEASKTAQPVDDTDDDVTPEDVEDAKQLSIESRIKRAMV